MGITPQGRSCITAAEPTAHSATPVVLSFTDLQPRGKILPQRWGKCKEDKFPSWNSSSLKTVSTSGSSGQNDSCSDTSKDREGEWSLNSVPELEEILLKHTGIKENTYVCHKKPFIRVNICLWQQNGLNIFQTQQVTHCVSQRTVCGFVKG